MDDVVAPYNPVVINPVCSLNTCLQEVAGLLDNSPALYEACITTFGAPATTVDSIVDTITTTESYTDIVVTLTTNTVTETDIVTAWQTISATAIQTQTATVTQTTTVTVVAGGLKARNTNLISKGQYLKKKKRACIPRASTVPGATTTTATSIPEPSSSSSSSSIPCDNLDAFSSACSCITAASDAYVTTVTVTEATSTGTITATVTARETSISTSTELETAWTTNTVTSLTTTTVATTTTTITLTSTVTTTRTVIPTPHVGWWKIHDANNWFLVWNRNAMRMEWGGLDGSLRIAVPFGGGQPYMAEYPEWKMVARRVGYSAGWRLDFAWIGNPQPGDTAVVCDLASDGVAIECNVPGAAGDPRVFLGFYSAVRGLHLTTSGMGEMGLIGVREGRLVLGMTWEVTW
ncbi:hypothetical protein VTJ04DRAFT_9735 [Mycothermus thermophilus]|uniref:uncharacterized protein n=1 Tax=Humicola insolens TaxID=85995 RepID=UPI00374206FA